MRAIIIGAGRGIRLMPTTADTPKCYAEIQGRRILDWILHAFRTNGIEDICFIGGYLIEVVKKDYPQFTFRHNTDWENNNILESLMYAEDLMEEPFICCYSDILFTQDVVQGLMNSSADFALSVDTGWKERYTHRTEHPPDDAEKVTVENQHITRIHRGLDYDKAYAEYTGVAKFTAQGASRLRKHYNRAKKLYSGKPFREAKVFEKAYLIHLLQDMIEAGIKMAHVDTHGGYMEIDTQQDFELGCKYWEG